MEPPGRGGAAGSGARPPAPTPFGALVWAVTQKAPARSRAPGGGVRPGARRAAGQVGRVPKGRAGSWGCRRRRRAPGARPTARGACLAERGAGAPGPPRDAAAAAAAASVGSTRARCGERSVSFGLFLCSAPPGFWAARGGRRDVCAPRAAAPGAWEAGKGGCLLAYWGIFWMVSRGATGVPGRGVPSAAGRPRGAGEMVPGVAFLPSAGGLGLTASRRSPQMPPGAPVLGSSSRARAARAPEMHVRARAPYLRPHASHTPMVLSQAPSLAPSPPPEVALARPSAATGHLRGGEGAEAGQMLGGFCVDPRAWGACSWKGSGRTK